MTSFFLSFLKSWTAHLLGPFFHSTFYFTQFLLLLYFTITIYKAHLSYTRVYHKYGTSKSNFCSLAHLELSLFLIHFSHFNDLKLALSRRKRQWMYHIYGTLGCMTKNLQFVFPLCHYTMFFIYKWRHYTMLGLHNTIAHYDVQYWMIFLLGSTYKVKRCISHMSTIKIYSIIYYNFFFPLWTINT